MSKARHYNTILSYIYLKIYIYICICIYGVYFLYMHAVDRNLLLAMLDLQIRVIFQQHILTYFVGFF